MTNKLKINIRTGEFEAEGSEQFIKNSFDNFMTNSDVVATGDLPQKSGEKPSTSSAGGKARKKKTKTTSANKAKGKKGFENVPELMKHKEVRKIKEFVERYEAIDGKKAAAMKTVLIFVYCLEKTLEINTITINHLYTCYTIIKRAKPKDLNQALSNAKSNGWLHGETDAISLLSSGEDEIENHLKKQNKGE